MSTRLRIGLTAVASMLLLVTGIPVRISPHTAMPPTPGG
jgi:hypothetical protein